MQFHAQIREPEHPPVQLITESKGANCLSLVVHRGKSKAKSLWWYLIHD